MDILKNKKVILFLSTLVVTLQSTFAQEKTRESAQVLVQNNDSYGVILFVLVAVAVFLALILSFLLLRLTRKFMGIMQEKQEDIIPVVLKSEEAKPVKNDSGEVYAAIAMALYQYQSKSHDIQQTRLTMKKVERTYSPWSSKIYGLRTLPTRK